MSLAIYLVGFLIFLFGLCWGLTVLGVPHLYVAIGAVILAGIGICMGVSRTRMKDPPAGP